MTNDQRCRAQMAIEALKRECAELERVCEETRVLLVYCPDDEVCLSHLEYVVSITNQHGERAQKALDEVTS